jgi:membrane protein YdbS with pleckstrin-like domain
MKMRSSLLPGQRTGKRKEQAAVLFLLGLSGGFAIGIAMILVLESGWYTRANMEANSRLSSVILLIAILIISFFMAFFYRKFRWEMQEQRYLELLAAKNKAENQGSKQP